MKTLLWKAWCLFMFRSTMRFGHKSHWTYSLWTSALPAFPLWTLLMCFWRRCSKYSFPHRWQITFVSVLFFPLQRYLRCEARWVIVKDIPQSWHSFLFFKCTASRCIFMCFLSKDLPQSWHFSRYFIFKWTRLMCVLRWLLESTLSQYLQMAVPRAFCDLVGPAWFFPLQEYLRCEDREVIFTHPSWMGQVPKIVTREVVYYILSGTPRAPQKCFWSNLRVEFLGENHFFLICEKVPNQTLWIS